MNKKQTIDEYIKQPITEADKNSLVTDENKVAKKFYILSLVLFGLFPFLNTFIAKLLMSQNIDFAVQTKQLDLSITSILIANLLVIAAYTVGMWSIRNVSEKLHAFGFCFIQFGLMFFMGFYQTTVNPIKVEIFDMFMFNTGISMVSALILATVYMLVFALIANDNVVEVNNKKYYINSKTLALSDEFNENILMNDDSKQFYQSIKKLGRAPYKFEHDIIVDMNLKEYETQLQFA